MQTVRLPRRDAEALAEFIEPYEPPTLEFRRAFDALARALRPSPKKRNVRRVARQGKAAKRATVREKRQAVRAAVFERAAGRCEALYVDTRRGERCDKAPDELDHFFGRARDESVQTCWALCGSCHTMKTRNYFGADYWQVSFILHAEAHGYFAAAEKARKRLDGILSMRGSNE